MSTGSSLFLLGLALAGLAVANQQCAGPTLSVKTSSLVQKATNLAHSHVRVDAEEESEASSEMTVKSLQRASEKALARGRAEDARFLMRATFGPTRASLEELGKTTYEDWIKEQVSLPVESHREYYRKHVNPQFHAQTVGRERSPCAKGARWHNYALTQKDVGKQIKVQGSKKILIDGGFRTDIQEGPLPSSWVGLANYTGHVCYVKEDVGADVHVSASSRCRSRRRMTVMPNPSIWMAAGAPSVDLPFQIVKPGAIALKEDAPSCKLDEELKNKQLSGDALTISAHGKFYNYNARLELLENTPGSPAQDAAACVPRTFLNEETCQLPTFAASSGNRTVQGLKATVMAMGDGMSMTGTPIAEVTDSQVNHPHKSMMDWDGFPSLTGSFGVRWTGTLNVKQAGEYEFQLKSDDGSSLSIDEQRVVDNMHRRRRRGMREAKRMTTLAAGSHDIRLDYRQSGGSLGMILNWKGPDSMGQTEAIPSSALSSQPPSWSGGCFLACGSPGEVANEGGAGHHLAMWTTEERDTRDIDYDSRYADRMDSKLAKSTVWTAKVLGAKDQLRQRTAWALSQIFVVSTQGVGDNHLSEMWINFYDIFVRHAFGNFRDVLREVSYSPLMGMYLTHTGSSSYAYNGRFPNENYAREIMQLFTIGLDKLNPDGSVQVDAEGKDVPTYGTDHIMNFARVFTGFLEQQPRANIEYRERSNMIDPMRVVAKRHDIYPKPDLDGNFLGDGLPLCADTAVAGAFLDQGARYSFHGTHGPSDALDLSLNSELFLELCASQDPAQCKFKTIVELSKALQCTGKECDAGAVAYVKVGVAYYGYVPPTCVHKFFLDSIPKEGGNETMAPDAQQGSCLDAQGKGIGRGTRLDSIDVGNTPARQAECLEKCRSKGALGCMLIWNRWSKGCYAQFRAVAKGSGADRHLCWGFTDSGASGHSYMRLRNDRLCPAGTEITSMAECQLALQTLDLTITRSWWVSRLSEKNAPTGCSWSSGRPHWGIHSQTKPRRHLGPICRAHVQVDEEGKLLQLDGQTKFSVPWLGSAPPPQGSHLVRVETRQAFDRKPTKAELLAKLSFGAPRPHTSCSECGGDVQAYYGAETGVSASTVFELDGKFYKNSESVVSFVDSPHAFRNPPVFLRSASEPGADRQAVAEVEALLDHLFNHQNTPVFIGRRFIQRFGLSNPSPGYIRAVGEAFRTGSYGGEQFSGKYGDLAATVAATLLHPEGHGQAPGADGETTLEGALREPLLKFVHMMRSMEYQDKAKSHVVFDELQDVIGQFPYQSPTVFNFYMADYELPMPSPEPEPEAEPEPEPEKGPEPEPEPETEPEPESEMEPEPEPEAPKKPPVAPEFQIFTPPLFVGYLNGMSSLIKSGVSRSCDGGRSLGISVRTVTEGRWRDMCPQGTLTWQGQGDQNATLEEMNLLLTGGRLTPAAKQVVKAAYEQAPAGERVQAAQQAVAMTAEFNTLGPPKPLSGRRLMTGGGEQTTRKPYKAMVMLFLGGGADTWNLLVPQDCDLYQEYRSIRTDLSLSPNELIKISSTGQPCQNFGVHARFSFLKSLYDKGQAAFVSNIGNLVEPTDKQKMRSGTAQRCFGLFSHSDQQNGAQTLKCQDMGTSARGAGGRVADALATGSQHYHTTSFSLAGSAIWPMGVTTQREIVGQRSGHGFHEYEQWRDAISNITAQRHGNAYSEAYAKAFLDSIQNTVTLGRTLEGVKLKTNYPARNGLERELQQVAKLIASHEARHAERDFFFVSLGGWDMHSMMKQRLDSRFRDIDAALTSFVAEMEAQKMWESVALATESEFARTLDSNGGGSDHAWAGQHFVISGGLKGGKIFNKFPRSLKAGNERDLGRGRLIPEFPWESMMVPLAEWMGLEQDQKEVTFPNIGYFNSSHIIPRSSLFKS